MLGMFIGIISVWITKKTRKYIHERRKWNAFVAKLNAQMRAEKLKV